MATEQKNWTVIVCGDFDKPLAILVPDPVKWTISDLKKEVSKKINVPEGKQILYCLEKVVPEGIPLPKCEGMENGVALCLALKPVIISAHCADLHATVQVEIPQNEFGDWTVSDLRNIVCAKFNLEPLPDHILALEGDILEDEMKVNEYIKGDCTVIIAPMQHVILPTLNNNGSRRVALPINTSLPQVSEDVFYKREIKVSCDASSTAPWTGYWVVSIRKDDDTKKDIRLASSRYTPVFHLRELVQKEFSIPPHQQKLTAGTTVLEDWDEDGKVLLLCNYPYIHDGVTIELCHVTEGIHVKLEGVDDKISLKISEKNGILSKEPKICPPDHINIPNPREMTVRILGNIMTNCGLEVVGQIFNNSLLSSCNSFPISNARICDTKLIRDGCMLGIKKSYSKF